MQPGKRNALLRIRGPAELCLGLRSRAKSRASTLGSGAKSRASTPLAATLLLAFGCGGAPSSSYSPTAGSQAGAAGGAIITAIAAGTLWAAGGGCRLQGCSYGSYCNKKSGFCDVRTCEQGCPETTICNEGLNRCQAAPPPQTPNDFLPQDDKRLPPVTH